MNINKIGILTGGVPLSLLFIFLPWYPIQLIAALLLLGFWPGYALLAAFRFDSNHASLLLRWTEGILAVAVSYGLTVALLLFIALVAIPLGAVSVAGSLAGLSFVFTFIAWRRQSKATSSQPSSAEVSTAGSNSLFVWLIIVLLAAAFFRVVNVGYSDLQGDEADILLRAVSLTYGHIETVWTHSKGPGEILLLNGIGALTGRFDEPTVRLPFSLASTVSSGLVVLVGSLLFNPLVGIIAGLLVAVDGVFVSYARTAQYQSVVLMLTLAAIWCFYRFYQTGGQARQLHALGAFLLAGAFLFHFETILLLPVVAYLAVAHLPRPENQFDTSATAQSLWSHLSLHLSRFSCYASRLIRLWPSAVIFVAVTAAFYIPFLLHPAIRKTGTYLESRINSGSFPPFNNLDHFFYREAIKYNAAQYAAFFALFLLGFAAVVFIRMWQERGGGKNILQILCLTSVGLGTLLSVAGLEKVSALLVGLSFALFFALLIFSSQTPASHRTLWLWIVPPFLVYVFLVNRAGKHHYLFLPALILFLALAVTQFWNWLATRWPEIKKPVGQWLALSFSILLWAIFAGHTVMVLLRSDLEYILTFPTHKSWFYPTDSAYPYDTRIGFGYPFRLGWQVVGRLKRSGQLAGSWAGNDTGNAPNWYMLNTPQTPCYPDYVLRGEITYKGDDKFDVPFEPAQFGYTPRYRIWGNDRLRMTILAFDPLGSEIEPVDLDEAGGFDPPVTAADFEPSFKRPATPEAPPQILLEPPLVLGEGSEIKNNVPAEYLERAQTLRGRVALLGYDLDERYAVPGGIMPVTLHWQVQSLLSLRYKVFVHLLGADGQLQAQADDFPVCGTFQANAWGEGATVQDRHLLKLPPDLPPGDYRLVVGMYEPELNLRLNYFDIAGNEQGNSLAIGAATIRSE